MNVAPNQNPGVVIHPQQRKNFMVCLIVTLLILIPLKSLTSTDNSNADNTLY